MRPKMSRYISKKLDGEKGEIPRLKKMFSKSFTAPNFRSFWNAWNPIYSYVLTYFVYSNLRSIIGKTSALLVTFLINGLFHDIIVFLLLKRTSFNVSKLFIIYGLLVIIETKLNISIKNKSIRVLYNLILVLLPAGIIVLFANI